MEQDGEEYWNTTSAKAFSFDEVDDVTPIVSSSSKGHLFPEDNISEISAEESLPQTDEFLLSQLISDEDLKMLINEQSLEEEPIRKGISHEEELRILRRKIQDTIHPPPVEINAIKLLIGKRCFLEPYKSLQDKIDILDEVIRTGNGAGILGIVLFLEKTLNRKQLNRILLHRPEASNHYLNFLETKMKIAEATDLLTMLGRDNDAAMLQFKIAMKMNPDPEIRKQKLKKVYSDYFTQPDSIKFCTELVGNSINLLEWQLLEKSKGLENSYKLVDSSPVESLYYSCSKFKWKDLNSTEPTNPYKFITDYKINSGIFEWTALNERAKTQAYLDLEGIFEKTSWHSLKQKQFQIHIPLDVAILRLYDLKAPPPVLNIFLTKISDLKHRLQLAKQVKCTRSIIDALTLLKEKQELEEYRNSLVEGSEERFYAENSLKNIAKKWSTDSLKIIKK